MSCYRAEDGACLARWSMRAECITIPKNMPYYLAAAVMHIWRYEHEGTKRQNLEKAVRYLRFEIANIDDEGQNA